MTRSLKVRSECIKKVEMALRLNGFPRQKDLAEELELALSTVSNFLTGKRVAYLNFLEICQKLGLDWKEVAELNVSPGTSQKEKAVSTIFILHRPHNPDRWLAQQFYEALKDDGYEVIMSGENIRPREKGLQHIDEELIQCDYLLLLLSPQSATSEMTTEQVRRAKELRDLSPNYKPAILTIRISLPLNAPLNYDLLGYLHKTWQREWQPNTHTVALIQEVRGLLKNGDVLAADEPQAALLTSPPAQEYPEVPVPVAEPELPEGQIELASIFYVERPPIEERCYLTVGKPGSLIRIKAARQMGKTSLMAKVLHHATNLGYLTVPLSFQLADATVFSNLDRFLQWFCASISWQLELTDTLTDYWSSMIGSKMSCTNYWERYLLPKIVSPLVLGLDEVDRVFQYPEIATDFFGLLRAWHEYAKNRDCWKKLRLIVVHSTEVYVPQDINQSPFNVGLPISLPEFTSEQVHDLAQRHRLNWDTAQVEQLIAMVGGHPFLVRVALYHIAQQEMTLEQVLKTASTEAGLYSDHLRRHLWNLENHPKLVTAMQQVVSTSRGVRLKTEQAFRLHSMGLVHLQGNDVIPRCQLYRQYFSERLGVS